MGRKSHKRLSALRHYSRPHSSCNKPSSFEHPEPPVLLSDDDIRQLKTLFEKSFSFERPLDPWLLPPSGILLQDPAWCVEDFMQLKHNLNSVKNQLSEFAIEEWHQHTSYTHRAGLVVSHVRRNVKPELCTQAWCKFLEIQHNLGGVTSLVTDNTVNSVHLCEAPGAFITCFNHVLQSSANQSIAWRWIANTLNPYYEGNTSAEMISDDRFIVNTLQNWSFGADDSGNIMSTQNLTALEQEVKAWKRVDLVTADGSVDCANEPERQEEMVSHLHLCEVTTALHLLSRHGSFVLKTFTLLESSSVCLMFLLNCLFEKVKVFKPTTSKPGNSEVYVLCQNFLGVSTEVLDALKKAIDRKSPLTIFSRSQIPDTFIEQHRKCCQFFIQHQIKTITENVHLYSNMNQERKLHLESQRLCFIDMFMERYRLSSIDTSLRIFNERKPLKSLRRAAISRSRHTGSYLSRKHDLNLPWPQRLALYSQMELSLTNIQQLWLPTKNTFSPVAEVSFTCVVGKPYSSMMSSPFCDADLMKTYVDFLGNSDTEALDLTYEHYESGFQSVLEHIVLNAENGETSNYEKPKYELNVVTCGSRQGHFKQFLTAQNKLSVLVIERTAAEHSSKPRTYLMDGVVDDPEVKYVKSDQPMRELFSAFKMMSSDDHLVLNCSPCLNRLSVSVLYLMQITFKQVFVVFSSSSSVLYLFGLSHMTLSPALSNHIAVCSQTFDNRSEDSVLLSAIDTRHLLTSPFYSSVCSMNDIFLKQHLKYLIEKNSKVLTS